MIPFFYGGLGSTRLGGLLNLWHPLHKYAVSTMPEDLTQNIDIDERLAKAAELNLSGDSGDDDDVQMGDFDLESDLRGQKPTPADLRSSLSKSSRGGEDNDDVQNTDLDNFLFDPSADDDDDAGDDDDSQQTPPAAGQQTPPAGDQQAASFDQVFFEKFKQHTGIDLSTKYRDADSAVAGLGNLTHKIGERDQLAEYGRKLLESPLEVYEHLQKMLPQLRGGHQPPEQKQDVPDPNIPQWDDAWLEQVKRDENGQLVALPGVDPSIPSKIAKYQDYLQRRTRELATDPKKALKPLLENDFRALAEQAAREAVERFRNEQQQLYQMGAAQAEAYTVLQEESRWLFVDGDQSKGMTEAGKIFKKWVDYAELPADARGTPRIPNVRDRRDFAKAKTYEELTALQRGNSTQSRQVSKQKVEKKPVRGAGKGSQQRAGWKKGVSLEQALMAAINGAQD